MPDGRPLGQFLQETQAEPSKTSKNGEKKTRRLRKAERQGGWSHKAVYRSAQPNVETENSSEDNGERLGRDRRRRFLNEKILRDMAGSMTASDMEALFKPVPFGETGHVSIFTQATAPHILPIWDLFRNINEDKQNRYLQAYETHLRAQRAARKDSDAEQPLPPSLSGLTALKSWAKVPRKAREAMKRSTPAFVEDLELPVLEYLDEDRDAGGEEAVLQIELEDGYQRLIMHGIATYHCLESQTMQDGFTNLWSKQAAGRRGSPEITCADIVFALGANPAGGLTAQVLNANWKRIHIGSDTGSEAAYVPI